MTRRFAVAMVLAWGCADLTEMDTAADEWAVAKDGSTASGSATAPGSCKAAGLTKDDKLVINTPETDEGCPAPCTHNGTTYHWEPEKNADGTWSCWPKTK